MNPGLKLQLAVIAASGLVVALLGIAFIAGSRLLTPRTMIYLLAIPPLSVSAYSFVFAFVRDRTNDLPGFAESAIAIAQATAVSALLFALMATGMLFLVRLGAKFLS